MAHWVAMRYGISDWKARRWIASAHALEHLPAVAGALASGELGVDKVVELTRFATPETEAQLITWAQGVSSVAIRRRGDLLVRQSTDELVKEERTRFLRTWFYDGGRRFSLEADLPGYQGAVVAKELDRLAETIPVIPGEEGLMGEESRRADALVALCSTRVAADPVPDRATVIVHAPLDALRDGRSNAEVERGPVISGATAQRLACNGRVQLVIEDAGASVIRLGRMTRQAPAWMMRQLRYRDRECRFPGCGSRRYSDAHHIRWWEHGGRTDLENLVLICSFHHKLVHEYGWKLKRHEDGRVDWFLPDGTRYRAGPAPPVPKFLAR
jgi:hypothetical protein